MHSRPNNDHPARVGRPHQLPRKGGATRVGYVEPYQIRTVSQDRLSKRIDTAEEKVRREVAHRIELFTRCRS